MSANLLRNFYAIPSFAAFLGQLVNVPVWFTALQ